MAHLRSRIGIPLAIAVTVGVLASGCSALSKVRQDVHNVENNRSTIDSFTQNLQSNKSTPFEATYTTTGTSPATVVYAVDPSSGGLAFHETQTGAGCVQRPGDRELVGRVRVQPERVRPAPGRARSSGTADAATENKIFDFYTPSHWISFLKGVSLVAGLAGDKVTSSTMSLNGFDMNCVDLVAHGVPGTSTICSTSQGILGYVKVASDSTSFQITNYSSSPVGVAVPAAAGRHRHHGHHADDADHVSGTAAAGLEGGCDLHHPLRHVRTGHPPGREGPDRHGGASSTTAGCRAVAGRAVAGGARRRLPRRVRAAGAPHRRAHQPARAGPRGDGREPWFGTPVNPLDPARVPGGSSSGSAVAVASGEADVAFGSDTGGSVRIPSACCGTAGLKTTWGRIPLDGVWPLSPSFDTVGPMARDVAGSGGRHAAARAGFPRAARRWDRPRRRPAAHRCRPGDHRRHRRGTPPGRVGLPGAWSRGWDQATVQAGLLLVVEAWQSDAALVDEDPEGIGDDVRARLRSGRQFDDATVRAAWRSSATGRPRWTGLHPRRHPGHPDPDDLPAAPRGRRRPPRVALHASGEPRRRPRAVAAGAVGWPGCRPASS